VDYSSINRKYFKHFVYTNFNRKKITDKMWQCVEYLLSCLAFPIQKMVDSNCISHCACGMCMKIYEFHERVNSKRKEAAKRKSQFFTEHSNDNTLNLIRQTDNEITLRVKDEVGTTKYDQIGKARNNSI
jgi:hypothetical protein